MYDLTGKTTLRLHFLSLTLLPAAYGRASGEGKTHLERFIAEMIRVFLVLLLIANGAVSEAPTAKIHQAAPAKRF